MIALIFVEGGSSINKQTKAVFKKITGRDLRHKRQSSTSFYYETLFGKYLNNYELVAEAYPLGYYYDISPLNRQLGLWLFGSGAKELMDARVATLSAWRRNKKQK